MRPQYSITTQPAVEPLTIAEASAHLRVDSTDDAELIAALISVARDQADSLTGRVSDVTSFLLIAQTWESLCGDSTSSRARTSSDSLNCIPIYRTPLISVESIKYIASGATALTTIDPSDYAVIITSEPGMIQMLEDLPALADRPDAIQIAVTAGYDGDTTIIPPTHKHLVRMLVSHYYQNRDSVVVGSIASEIPMTANRLIQLNKIAGWVA